MIYYLKKFTPVHKLSLTGCAAFMALFYITFLHPSGIHLELLYFIPVSDTSVRSLSSVIRMCSIYATSNDDFLLTVTDLCLSGSCKEENINECCQLGQLLHDHITTFRKTKD